MIESTAGMRALESAISKESSAEAADEGASLDLDALAERVFALLKQELRIERERLGMWRGG